MKIKRIPIRTYIYTLRIVHTLTVEPHMVYLYHTPCILYPFIHIYYNTLSVSYQLLLT